MPKFKWIKIKSSIFLFFNVKISIPKLSFYESVTIFESATTARCAYENHNENEEQMLVTDQAVCEVLE